ncbi:hypothetical protein [Burkholderia singularis]|uniref:hypothetical protein n=1 Tax=Burkholderia singularis TaxID=1503053 RepID=UPI001FE00A34|nr:hypothetical protein [Burkholderia singularis]
MNTDMRNSIAPADNASRRSTRTRLAHRAAAALALLLAIGHAACARVPAASPAPPPSPTSPPPLHGAPLVQGIVWQPDDAHANPRGDWDVLGVTDLLVQWSAVDGVALVAGAGLPTVARLPDWKRIGREPWARNVIVGLAGRFDETEARERTPQLVAQSLALALAPPAVHVSGWYFPVEVDPTWKRADTLKPLLEALPKPLWISVYDNSNIGGPALAAWLDSWLPHDVGVFFQDGCGGYVREPRIAREYADALAATLGAPRVRIIAEAFRTLPNGTLRAATAAELQPQLEAYRGYPAYLFDGPHYVPPGVVRALAEHRAAAAADARRPRSGARRYGD